MERLFEYKDESLFCHYSLDECPDPADFYVHAHERMELLLFISGDAVSYVEGSEYLLKPYDVLIMRSAEIHRTHILSQVPYERIAVHFSPELVRRVDPEGLLLRPFTDRPLGRLNHYSGDNIDSLSLHRALHSMDSEAGPSRSRLRVATALMSLLSDISEDFERRERPAMPDDSSDIAAQLVEYINTNLFEEISLKSISRHFYLSQSQLNRIFGRATGSSLWEYVRIKRLLAAREKIVAGEKASKACTMCGFRDYSSFYRAYKARFGHAPSVETQAELRSFSAGL